MPRPTTAQVGYGSLAVVLSTFAMLLLSGARSGAGVVAIAAAGLAMGLAAAFAAAPRGARRPSAAASPALTSAPATTVNLPLTRVPGASETRVGEHSLRR